MTDVTELDAAWVRFAEQIKAAGQSITGPDFPDDARLRAEGYRYVGRLASLAQQIYLEFADTRHPMLFRFDDDISTFGAPNMDNNYARAAVDSAGTYRVSGDITGVKELLISVHEGEMALGQPAVLGELTLADLKTGADGWLDLTVGGPSGPINWLPMPDDTSWLNIRQFVGDWEHDPIAVLDIERLDITDPAPNATPQSIAAGLEQAGNWVKESVAFWNSFAGAIAAMTPVNDFLAPMRPPGGAQNMVHGATRWSLKPGQAMIVEFNEPAATYWSMQTYMLPWLTPLDGANHVTSLNDGQVKKDSDGKIRIIVSDVDPGIQNWLDTTGLVEGLCTYRWVRSSTEPTPSTSVVDAATVRDHLPADTPTYTAGERRAQIAARHRGIARRFRR